MADDEEEKEKEKRIGVAKSREKGERLKGNTGISNWMSNLILRNPRHHAHQAFLAPFLLATMWLEQYTQTANICYLALTLYPYTHKTQTEKIR